MKQKIEIYKALFCYKIQIRTTQRLKWYNKSIKYHKEWIIFELMKRERNEILFFL